MAVGDGVKLIDVGGVMRIDDDDAAIFGTAGFQAPEVAADGPSVASDLFTVGRTLAVLILDFVFHAGTYQYALPPPRDAGVLARWESLHRFLLKATAFHRDDRFQSADEMADQLTGVLREIVAVTEAEPHSVPSKLFGGDRLTSLLDRRPDPHRGIAGLAIAAGAEHRPGRSGRGAAGRARRARTLGGARPHGRRHRPGHPGVA